MVLGKLPVPGRPTIWITVGQGPSALVVGAGGGCLDIFTLIYPFFPLSLSLWEKARYRLKYCLKGPLNPKPTNNQKILCILTLLTTTVRWNFDSATKCDLWLSTFSVCVMQHASELVTDICSNFLKTRGTSYHDLRKFVCDDLLKAKTVYKLMKSVWDMRTGSFN